MTRVAVLLSGGGSNMVTLLRDMQTKGYATPVGVISNNPDAGGLIRAAELGVEAQCVDHRNFRGDRQAFEKKLQTTLDKLSPDIVCLAGFMRILTREFVLKWAGRMINIHPSLLPKYPGLNTHQRALDAGDDEAGCSVHEVIADLDAGPLLGQARVPVLVGDTAQTLAARVLKQEHKLYPAVLERYVAGHREPIFLSYDDEMSTKVEPEQS